MPPAGDPAKPHREDGAVSAGVGPEEIWQEPVNRLLERLATIPSGLDTAEAQARFAVYGYNTAAAATRSPLWLQFLARASSNVNTRRLGCLGGNRENGRIRADPCPRG
jgi:magnesium-transporting ATPase (P-type)